MDKKAAVATMPKHASAQAREGLLLCMLLSICLDAVKYPNLVRELAVIARQEPEFTGNLEEFERILERAQEGLHKGPDELLGLIRSLLATTELRRRGLELAVRVVTSDGIVTHEQRTILRQLAGGLELPPSVLEDAVVAAQKRLVRFMMIYLVYLTALSDGRQRPEEFEEMIPLVLTYPAFSGVTTDEFAFMCRSVRGHLDQMKTDKGLDYITATIKNASELLEDPDLPRQALRIVARGVFADNIVEDSEKDFFRSIAEKLDLSANFTEKVLGEVEKEKTT